MTENKFTEKALFDLDYINGQKYYQKTASEEAEKFYGYTQQDAVRAQDAQAKQSAYESRTAPITKVSQMLTDMERMKNSKYGAEYAPIHDAAVKYLDNLMQKGLSPKEAAEINNGKAPKIDLDGSKKSFFGKLKSKAKNFWKPHNAKLQMEEQLAAFKTALAKDPSLISYVQGYMSSTEHTFPSTFKEIAAKRDRINEDLNSTRSYHSSQGVRNDYVAEKAAEKSQSHQQTLEAIGQERDKAAKEIELRSIARENVGIKDSQTNTGVDKLAEKAEAMKNMSPQQRLAVRMGQLRGTAKAETKTTVKRDIDPNVMNRNMENKLRA